MKRVAILLPGGIGPRRPEGMYLPSIEGLVRRLSASFDIVAFTFVKPDLDDAPFRSGRAEVRYTGARFDDPFPLKLLRYAASFRAEHVRHPFGLVHGFWGLPCGLAASALGKWYGIPSVVSFQGGEAADLPDLGYGDLRRPGARALLRWACARAARITALTRYQAEILESRGIVPRPVTVIPYGAEPDFVSSAPPAPILPPLRILHVGFANGVKDRATLLRTFRRLRDAVGARMRVAGGGPLQEASIALARDLGVADDVEFLGTLPHADLPRHYRWAQIMLHTPRYEAQGVALAEGAAAGLLLCGTHAGLIADLASDPSPAAVEAPPGDDETLSRRILAALGHPGVRERSAAWARVRTADRTSEDFRTLYEELACSPPAPRIMPALEGAGG